MTLGGGKAFQTKRLMVTSADGNPLSGLGEKKMLKAPDGSYVLHFKTEYDAMSAHESVSSQGNAKYVGPDEIIVTQANSWGVGAMSADQYVNYLEYNRINDSVIVAVVDTGVDATHPFLRNHITEWEMSPASIGILSDRRWVTNLT